MDFLSLTKKCCSIRNEFKILDNLEPVAILAIGYAATKKASSERHDTERVDITSITKYETF